VTTARLDVDQADDTDPDDPASEMDERRRAMRLCLGAEPHTDVAPCQAHRHQALRQLSLVRTRPEDPG